MEPAAIATTGRSPSLVLSGCRLAPCLALGEQLLGLPAIEFNEVPALHFGIEHFQGSAAGVDLVVMGEIGEPFESAEQVLVPAAARAARAVPVVAKVTAETDSLAEGKGFEPSVPRSSERTSGAKSDLGEDTRRHVSPPAAIRRPGPRATSPRISRAPAIGANGTSMTATGPLLFGPGIHEQYLFVDAQRHLVIAKVPSQDLPLDAALIASTLRAVLAVRRALAG